MDDSHHQSFNDQAILAVIICVIIGSIDPIWRVLAHHTVCFSFVDLYAETGFWCRARAGAGKDG